MKRALAMLVLVLSSGGIVLRAQETCKAASDVPKGKQTTLGLYVTATEAYEKWRTDPEHVRILDVRTPEEYVFVGHAEGAWNVPLLLQTYAWDASGRALAMTPNPEFLDRVKKLFNPSDTLLVMCRSGGRSARAVDLLASAGFKQVYSVVDGMEGDVVNDLASPQFGKRAMNGWKNSALPWTYDLDPGKMSLPAAKP